MTKLQQLFSQYGQSPWLDNLTRPTCAMARWRAWSRMAFAVSRRTPPSSLAPSRVPGTTTIIPVQGCGRTKPAHVAAAHLLAVRRAGRGSDHVAARGARRDPQLGQSRARKARSCPAHSGSCKHSPRPATPPTRPTGSRRSCSSPRRSGSTPRRWTPPATITSATFPKRLPTPRSSMPRSLSEMPSPEPPRTEPHPRARTAHRPDTGAGARAGTSGACARPYELCATGSL